MLVLAVKPHVFEHGVVVNKSGVVVFVASSGCHRVLFCQRIDFMQLLRPGLVVALVAEGIQIVTCWQKACERFIFILCALGLVILIRWKAWCNMGAGMYKLIQETQYV